MFTDAYTKLDSAKTAQLFEILKPHLDAPFSAEALRIMIHDLPFYPGHFIAEIASHAVHPPVLRHAVCDKKGGVVMLDWTAAPIQRLNREAPLRLNEKTISSYVRFYLMHTRGRHGRFLIIDTVDDIDWREEPAPSGRKAIAKMIEPMRLFSAGDDGSYIFLLTLAFRDSLFQAKARIEKDGALTLFDEELLIEDIPIADDLFGE
jgi:hypothetical protein